MRSEGKSVHLGWVPAGARSVPLNPGAEVHVSCLSLLHQPCHRWREEDGSGEWRGSGVHRAWSQHLLDERRAEAGLAHQLACGAAIHYLKVCTHLVLYLDY